MRKLLVDESKCIGCGLCNKICFAHHLGMSSEKKCIENTDTLCIECGQCATICPKSAIKVERLQDAPSMPMALLDSQIEPENFRDFLKSRRSCRYFTDVDVSKEEFDKLITYATCSDLSYWNIQTTEYVVIDKEMPAFKERLHKVYERELKGHDFFDLHGTQVDRDDVVRLYDQYMKGEFPFDQFFIGGRQAIAVFAEHQYDAIIGMSHIELMAHAMKLGGFWHGFAITAALRYPEEMMEFFPTVSKSKRLYGVFVIGPPKYKHSRIAPKQPATITYM